MDPKNLSVDPGLGNTDLDVARCGSVL